MRLKRAAVLLDAENAADGATLFEADDSLDTAPRAHVVDAADAAHLRTLCAFGSSSSIAPAGSSGSSTSWASSALADAAERWRGRVPGIVRDDLLADELAAARAFAADRRFMLEFFSATEAMAATLDTEHFHTDVIADADANFDDVETTLAHLFARPTAALAHRRYGAAFCDVVLDAVGPRASLSIAELGCGTGRFAHDFLARLAEVAPASYAQVTYTLVDLSPTLQASQRQRCAPHNVDRERCRFVSGDLLRWAPAEPVDVVISNEVIADLPVRPCYRDDVAVDPGEAAACVRRHGLSMVGLPHATLVNTGAIALVERLPQLLKRGGVAWVTEYGSTTRGPVRVVLGDHVEHSIHYGHLQTVAAAGGLDASVVRVVDLLGFDEATVVLDLENVDVLRRAVGPALGLPPLPRMAFSLDDIRAWLGPHAPRVHNLVAVPLDRHAMRADLFLALVARRT